MIGFIRKYPLASYFTIAFCLSWGGVLAVIAPGDIPAAPVDAERLFAFVYLAMLVGPPVAGLALTAAVSGISGLRAFRARLFTWRVPPRWYAVALLTAPLVLLLTHLVLAALSPDFRVGVVSGDGGGGPPGIIQSPSPAMFVLTSLLIGLGAGFFEELGWTGFALPAMRERHGVVVAGVITGVLWGAWHFLAVWWGSAAAFGSAPIPVFMAVALFSFLPPYRVIMAWVYERTNSLFVAIVMHSSLTASMIALGPAVTGWATVTYDLVFAGVLWAIVALLPEKVEMLKLFGRHDNTKLAY